MRPSSIAPNPEEFREAPPNSTVTLTSQRHAEKLPEISLEGMMLKLKLQYFGHLMRRVDSLEKTHDAGRDWGQEEPLVLSVSLSPLLLS